MLKPPNPRAYVSLEDREISNGEILHAALMGRTGVIVTAGASLRKETRSTLCLQLGICLPPARTSAAPAAVLDAAGFLCAEVCSLGCHQPLRPDALWSYPQAGLIRVILYQQKLVFPRWPSPRETPFPAHLCTSGTASPSTSHRGTPRTTCLLHRKAYPLLSAVRVLPFNK